MRVRIFVLLFCTTLFGTIGRAQSPKDTVLHTTTRMSWYTPDFDHHGIFKFLGSKLLGIEPDTLTYIETSITQGDSEVAFSMQLVADKKSTWFLITSDTSAPSFTNLPLEDRKILHPDGVQFIRALRMYLSCRDSCPDFSQGIFHMNTILMHALFSKCEPFEIRNERDLYVRGILPRFLQVQTTNAALMIPYVWGNILTEQKDGSIFYPFLYAHLVENNIDIRLYLRRFSIDYK